MKTTAFGNGRMFPVTLAIACAVISFWAWPQTPGVSGVPLATEDRVRNPGWWPTKGSAARSDYTGPTACAECHPSKAATQKNTPMAHAATPASNAEILHQHSQLVFSSGTYDFLIAGAEEGSIYSVRDQTNSVSQRLGWAFGNGQIGQTYVFERNGNFYESRVSFYSALQTLDLTLGHHAPAANDVAGALGRAMADPEVRLCFGCHTTASTTNGRFDATQLISGVTCEVCHGPGERHVAAMKRGQIKAGLEAIMNPARLNPVDAVDFCGACHRTSWDVLMTNTMGVANVRFQPYRLEKSRCWNKGDRRLTCVACHDPHQSLVRDPASYDSRCLSCHVSNRQEKVSSDHSGRACPVSTKQCVTCHMTKYEIPGSHAEFTDHWIRVPKANAAYPD